VTETIEVGNGKTICIVRELGRTTVVLSSGDYSVEDIDRVNSAIATLIDLSTSIHIRGDGGIIKLAAPLRLLA
jgi:hypothetical protein